MFEMMRKVFGPVAVAVIVGAIALVFVFSGVFNPKSGGIGGDAVAAKVNGDAISMQDFAREYQQRVEFYQNMMKGKVDENLLKSLGIQKQVIEELVRRKLMLQEAERMGLTVSDEEVRDKIREMPYFKNKEGKFDASQYNATLSANRYSPATFENMVREDLLRNHLAEFMRNRVRVSAKEVEEEFLSSEDRRQIDYVVLTRETAKKLLVVSDTDVNELLKTEPGKNAVKLNYEQNKGEYMKPMAKTAKGQPPAKPEFIPLEQVQRKVAVEVLKDRRTEELGKINRTLANELLAKAKAGQLKAFAKSKGLELKTTEKFNRQESFIPGVGDVPALMADAYKAGSPLLGEPKLYESNGRFVVAQRLQEYKPNPATFAKERERLESQAATRKSQQFYEQWMGELRAQAKVSMSKNLEEGAPGSL